MFDPAAFAVRESDSRLKRCWRAYLNTGNTLCERQQVQFLLHAQHHLHACSSAPLSHAPLLGLCPLVSQALKGIERALASSQGLEEEERTALALHEECIEASRMYRNILDKAATVRSSVDV